MIYSTCVICGKAWSRGSSKRAWLIDESDEIILGRVHVGCASKQKKLILKSFSEPTPFQVKVFTRISKIEDELRKSIHYNIHLLVILDRMTQPENLSKISNSHQFISFLHSKTDEMVQWWYEHDDLTNDSENLLRSQLAKYANEVLRGLP